MRIECIPWGCIAHACEALCLCFEGKRYYPRQATKESIARVTEAQARTNNARAYPLTAKSIENRIVSLSESTVCVRVCVCVCVSTSALATRYPPPPLDTFLSALRPPISDDQFPRSILRASSKTWQLCSLTLLNRFRE